jgi:hypothetical protein
MNIEGAYDHKVFFRLRTQAGVRAATPAIIARTAESPVPPVFTGQIGAVANDLRNAAHSFLTRGHEIVDGFLFGRFARSMGSDWLKPLAGAGMAPKAMSELSSTQASEWRIYTLTNGTTMDHGGLPKTEIYRPVRDLFHRLDWGSIKYLGVSSRDEAEANAAEAIRQLHGELTAASHRFVLNIIPDLDDADARGIFHHLMTAQQVRNLASWPGAAAR